MLHYPIISHAVFAKYLSSRAPKEETEKLESLKGAVHKLQEELTQQKLITETVSEENLCFKERIGKTEEKLSVLAKAVHEILEQTS